EEVQMTARMVDEIGADMDSFAYFSPYPGNELGERCIAENLSLLKPGTYDRYPTGQKITGIDYDYLDRVRAGLRE
ncbi:hypothetical protein LCGC14_2482600, partial [marine sediment metagenome]